MMVICSKKEVFNGRILDFYIKKSAKLSSVNFLNLNFISFFFHGLLPKNDVKNYHRKFIEFVNSNSVL